MVSTDCRDTAVKEFKAEKKETSQSKSSLEKKGMRSNTLV